MYVFHGNVHTFGYLFLHLDLQQLYSMKMLISISNIHWKLKLYKRSICTILSLYLKCKLVLILMSVFLRPKNLALDHTCSLIQQTTIAHYIKDIPLVSMAVWCDRS